MHDKKSDHYTSSKNYTDELGSTRSFDFVDHDVKTKVSTNRLLSDDERLRLREDIKEDRKKAVDRLLRLPPSMCPVIFRDFTLRGDREVILWNEKMLRDPGMDPQKVLDIISIVSNAIDLKKSGII